MIGILRQPFTHSARLERWLGADLVNGIAKNTEKWYGDPIPIMGIPGRVFVTGQGDFVGSIKGGFYSSLTDYIYEKLKFLQKEYLRRGYLNTGFSSLSDLIAEATGGKMQDIYYQKTATVAKPAAGYVQDLWNMGAVPAAGANGGAAAGGTVYNKSSTGALAFTDPAGSDTAHIISWLSNSDRQGALMLVDRLFAVSCSHNSANIAITGVPTRYQDTSARNSFCSARVTTILTATAHNITLTYMDQDGNTAEAAPVIAARVSSAVGTIPLTTPIWYIPINTGDTGIRKITNWATSGANTGVSDVYVAHPLAICPMPMINVPFLLDGINSAFNLVEVKAGACLQLNEYFMTATNVSINSGWIKVVSG